MDWVKCAKHKSVLGVSVNYLKSGNKCHDKEEVELWVVEHDLRAEAEVVCYVKHVTRTENIRAVSILSGL